MATKPTTLHEALLKAQRSAEAISKDAHNKFSGYDYVSAETMIQRCRDVLLEAGIVFTAGNVKLTPYAANDFGDCMVLEQGWRITYGDEVVDLVRSWAAVPSKGTPLDKAIAGSLTANLSYTLRDVLLIPRGDEPGVGMDSSTRDRRNQQPDQQLRESSQPTANGAQAFDRGDVAVEIGSNPDHTPGRRGEVFWVKGDRMGVKWGQGKEDITWGFMREFSAPVAEAPPQQVDERGESFTADQDIPF